MIRYVPANQKLSPLQTGLCINLSKNGIAMMMSSLPPKDETVEVYVPLNSKILIPALATNVWVDIDIDLEDQSADNPYWIKAGYDLSFHSKEDEKNFTQGFLNLGGKIRPVSKRLARVEYVF